jgi:hypothetical protein
MLRLAVPPGPEAQIDLAGRAGKESKAGWGEQLSMYHRDNITTLMVLCRRLQTSVARLQGRNKQNVQSLLQENRPESTSFRVLQDGFTRVYSSWHGTRTATGRLSSTEPNLQVTVYSQFSTGRKIAPLILPVLLVDDLINSGIQVTEILSLQLPFSGLQ